ncbi:putative protein N(5)-glutamine methyltransferase [Rhodococcus sp. X156]|uniref:putative protein N(5)-glutamine methyltransferase n=1 Tax=Rhodococcus sp. X156 TaxID=2499145 RepID=UPI000FD75A24|nr:putative protein N(5)-glutamine methyltransferase [Rhodococcus sp. X156]
MAVDLDPEHVSALVAQLRAAGCVFAEDEAQLLARSADTVAELAATVAQRRSGTPLEHVLGWTEFDGLVVAVDPGVFVPRRRTEALAEQAVTAARSLGRPPRVVVDLCCGCAAVGLAVLTGLASGPEPVDGVQLYASDIDAPAVRCAARNLAGTGARVLHGDLFDALPAQLHGEVDVVVANVPFVPTAELALLPTEARDHEPRVALDGGPDGLRVLARTCAAAPSWLAPGGRLLAQTSAAQAPQACALLSAHGLQPAVVHDQELDATVVLGRAPERHERSRPHSDIVEA